MTSVARAELDALMAQLVESSSDAILIVDDAGRRALTNDAVEEMFGFSSEELADTTVARLVPERSRRAHRELVAGFMRQQLGPPDGRWHGFARAS